MRERTSAPDMYRTFLKQQIFFVFARQNGNFSYWVSPFVIVICFRLEHISGSWYNFLSIHYCLNWIPYISFFEAYPGCLPGCLNSKASCLLALFIDRGRVCLAADNHHWQCSFISLGRHWWWRWLCVTVYYFYADLYCCRIVERVCCDLGETCKVLTSKTTFFFCWVDCSISLRLLNDVLMVNACWPQLCSSECDALAVISYVKLHVTVQVGGLPHCG